MTDRWVVEPTPDDVWWHVRDRGGSISPWCKTYNEAKALALLLNSDDCPPVLAKLGSEWDNRD